MKRAPIIAAAIVLAAALCSPAGRAGVHGIGVTTADASDFSNAAADAAAAKAGLNPDARQLLRVLMRAAEIRCNIRTHMPEALSRISEPMKADRIHALARRFGLQPDEVQGDLPEWEAVNARLNACVGAPPVGGPPDQCLGPSAYAGVEAVLPLMDIPVERGVVLTAGGSYMFVTDDETAAGAPTGQAPR